MSKKTDLSGLNNFLSKLEKVKSLNDDSEKLSEKISNAVADYGVELADKHYSSSGVSGVNVFKVNAEDADVAIVAKKEGLAFEEFGTGYQGLYSGYPDSKLPESGVPITGEWEYYYDNPKTKRTVGGRRGWFVPKDVTGENIDERGFTEGEVAGMQMYETSVELADGIAPELAKKIIKEHLK